MRVMIGGLITAGALLALVSVHPVFLLWLGLPLVLAVALVIARRRSPIEAAFVGGFVTFGLILLVALPTIVLRWLVGDWASGEPCDGFCMTNTEGFIFASFILMVVAVSAALAGGIMSAIASLVGVRPANSG